MLLYVVLHVVGQGEGEEEEEEEREEHEDDPCLCHLEAHTVYVIASLFKLSNCLSQFADNSLAITQFGFFRLADFLCYSPLSFRQALFPSLESEAAVIHNNFAKRPAIR